MSYNISPLSEVFTLLAKTVMKEFGADGLKDDGIEITRNQIKIKYRNEVIVIKVESQ